MTATQERLTTARRALERAEAAAGLRTRLRHAMPTPIPTGAPDPLPARVGSLLPDRSAEVDPAVGGQGGPAEVGDPAVGGEGGAFAAAVAGRAEADHLPVPAVLAGFFPPAGLRRGSVVQVGGSSSLLLALLAAAQGEGWVALAALPDIGLQAAAEAGLLLPRSLLVPRPGPEAASVVGALVDGVDVLAVGDCRALGARDRRLLSARLRSRGAVLLSTMHWPGADVVLRAAETRTDGLGRGWGTVQAGEMTVHGRGRSGVAGRVRVRVGPSGLGALADGRLGVADGGLTPAASAGRAPERPRLQAVS